MVEKLKEKINDPNYFPAIGTLENKDSTSKLKERFDELEEWVRPLSKSKGIAQHYYTREVENHLYRIDKLMKKKLIES